MLIIIIKAEDGKRWPWHGVAEAALVEVNAVEGWCSFAPPAAWHRLLMQHRDGFSARQQSRRLPGVRGELCPRCRSVPCMAASFADHAATGRASVRARRHSTGVHVFHSAYMAPARLCARVRRRHAVDCSTQVSAPSPVQTFAAYSSMCFSTHVCGMNPAVLPVGDHHAPPSTIEQRSIYFCQHRPPPSCIMD